MARLPFWKDVINPIDFLTRFIRVNLEFDMIGKSMTALSNKRLTFPVLKRLSYLRGDSLVSLFNIEGG